MRTALATALSLVALAGCATTRALEGPRPERVLVVASANVADVPSQRLLEGLLGKDKPVALIAREAERSLAARGYGVAADAVLLEAAPSVERLRDLAAANHADAVLSVSLDRMDLSALRPLGQAEIDLRASLISRAGKRLWSGEHVGVTHVATYRADADWRSHLRMALERSLGDLP